MWTCFVQACPPTYYASVPVLSVQTTKPGCVFYASVMQIIISATLIDTESDHCWDFLDTCIF